MIVDATFRLKILEELGTSNNCIFCTLAWKNGFAECVEFKLKINQSIMITTTEKGYQADMVV